MTLESAVAAERARRLRGSVALVTGATGGVGRGITRRLAAAGATVIACSRDTARADLLVSDLESEGVTGIRPAALDVADPESVGRLVTSTVEQYGRLDLLVNNAAVMHVEPVLEMSLDDLARVFQVNVGGVLAGVQAAARQMRTQEPSLTTGCRGKIINVSSPAADNPNSLEGAYGASKAAVNHLTRNVSNILAGDQISVTALYPGNVWEGMQSQLHHLAGDPPGEPSGQSARAKLEGWPTGRWQRPDETGDLAVFIASFVGMGLNGELIVAHPHRHRL